MADSIAVLHVEDDASFADLTATYLERDHPRFDVTVETDPIAAMDHLSAHDPDCIVSDYDMPRRSGIELLEAVRERHPTLPFILFTGKGSEEVASEAISTGVTDYLQKQPGTDQFALLANKIDNAVEHHRTERQLASEQRRRAALFSNFPEPTLAIDYVDGEGPIIRAVNPAFEATFGFDAEEAVGQSINDLIVPPGDHDAARDLDDLALEGNPVDTEVRRKTSSGPRDFLFRSIPVDGDVDFYGVYADITERKARERELRRVRDILDKAERIAQVGGWEIRTDPMEVFWTENCFDLLGVDDRTEPPLDDALDLYHEEDQARVEAAIERGIEEEASFDVEARLGDGGRWLRIWGEPVVEDDSVVALRGAVQDVTDRKERERELQRER